MHAFIAMAEDVAVEVDSSGQLSPQLLATKWLPLKENVEAAVTAAVQASAANGRIAVQSSSWYVLEIILPYQKFFELVREETLFRVKASPGWQWWGKLDVRKIDHTWWGMDLAPMGVKAWADMVLGPRYKKATAPCMHCQATGLTTWTSKKGESYCSSCWHMCWHNLEEYGKNAAREPEMDTDLQYPLSKASLASA
jgi:hypothetical protein